jgi:hypothetical protein
LKYDGPNPEWDPERVGFRSLPESWIDESKRLALMEDCCTLIDNEVRAKRGLKGATLRAGFAAVRRVKPGIIGYEVGKLMPAFLSALDPFYQQSRTISGDDGTQAASQLRIELEKDPPAVAEALLEITDELIRRARVPIQMAYSSMRGEARTHLEIAVPGLANVLVKHLTTLAL